jgi:carbonic anhydrase
MVPYEQIFENNKKWVAEMLAVDKDYFVKLSGEQKPDYLYIGCSDSRVSANVIMGIQPGEVFVHRNVANLVINNDSNVNAVIQYAVEFLKIKHIIICGHYGCGGIKAALQPVDMGQLNAWMQSIRDIYRIHQKELDKLKDEKKKFERLVELNVIEQCINVVKIDHVQRSWYKTGFPKIHGWIYDLHNGFLKDLNINISAHFSGIRSIYDINPL